VTPPPPAALRTPSASAVPDSAVSGSVVSGSVMPALARARSLSLVDAEVFRQALARHPAGVAIVTLRGPAGLTVTSFSSASLDPPLVSFYIGHGSSNWPAVRMAEHFAVNLMDHGQEAVAALFARKGAERFGPQTRWSPGPGDLPLLAGATTHLICATDALLTVGDHELVVGRVEHAIIGSGEPPLLDHQGRFTRTEPGTGDDR
jgi:flavin reductase (DIM6/NTAB) family NADH-FMN oxidoreductase RutF